MVTITTTADRLRRALEGTIPFASADDTLPMLNTVHVKAEGDRVQFAATDRYALGTYRLHRGERAELEGEDEFTGPDDIEEGAQAAMVLADAKEVLRTAKRYKKREALFEVSIAIPAEPERGVAFTFPDGSTLNARCADGEYPPVERLFPAGERLAESDQSEVIFNATFAAKVNKAAHAITGDRHVGVHLRLNTDSVKPAVFQTGEDMRWRCLLMPMRGL